MSEKKSDYIIVNLEEKDTPIWDVYENKTLSEVKKDFYEHCIEYDIDKEDIKECVIAEIVAEIEAEKKIEIKFKNKK